jgi:PEP-CTERM motif
MSKSAVLMLSFFLLVPFVAFASSNTFQNNGGRISSNGTYLSLSGSILSSVTMGGINTSGSLGAVSFTTGALISGSLDDGGTFAAGGSFQITGNGSNGIPAGVLFKGAFTGPVSWKAIWNPTADHHGDWSYELSGRITGTLANGQKLAANFVAYTFDVSQGGEFSSSVRFKDGMATTTSTVPEPGTMALLGTGLLGLGMLAFRKGSVRR